MEPDPPVTSEMIRYSMELLRQGEKFYQRISINNFLVDDPVEPPPLFGTILTPEILDSL